MILMKRLAEVKLLICGGHWMAVEELGILVDRQEWRWQGIGYGSESCGDQ